MLFLWIPMGWLAKPGPELVKGSDKMSYARFSGDSDIYAFPDSDGGYTCMVCSLMPAVPTQFTLGEFDPGKPHILLPVDFHCNTLEEFHEHVLDHVKNGDLVPEYCLSRIESELN